MNRREFLRTAGGATAGTAAVGAAGTATAQEGNESSGGGSSGKPDYGGYLDGVGNYTGTTVDKTGQDTVTVEVGTEANNGPYGYSPPAVHVDNGATVQFEWTGDGAHNVVGEDNPLDSGSTTSEAGVNYEHTFDSDGIYRYYCTPHKSLGMKGAIVVGSDYPTVSTGGNGGGGNTPVDPKHLGVPFQPHWVGITTAVAIFMSLVFTFFTLKYGESPNTKGGNN